jgi:hypothetical protein
MPPRLHRDGDDVRVPYFYNNYYIYIFVKMAGDCGLNALSLLPENVLPQWQQKIASQKIIIRPYQLTIGAGWIFCTKCDFLQVLDLHIFLQKQPGHWAEVVCHFHLLILKARCKGRPIVLQMGCKFA